MTNDPSNQHDVVIADDMPLYRELLRVHLERTGRYTVVAEAGNGVEAVEATRTHRPDVVLLDLDMPGVDGVQALPSVREAVPEAVIAALEAMDASYPETDLKGATLRVDRGMSPADIVDRIDQALR